MQVINYDAQGNEYLDLMPSDDGVDDYIRGLTAQEARGKVRPGCYDLDINYNGL